MAMDTEADSFYAYFQKLCLVQLSFAGRHALVDPLALSRAGLDPLVELLEDPSVTKVFHGADYDVRVLHRDLGARVRGLEDTQVAAQLLGEPRTGLAAMLLKELGVVVAKEHQRADFRRRPLPETLRRYAATDTAHLLALAEILRRRLSEMGRVGWWLEECRFLEGVEWSSPSTPAAPHERIPGAGKLAGVARDRLVALAQWRERVAAELDVAPFRVVRNETLLQLAREGAASLAELAGRAGVGKALARRFGKELLAILATPPPAPPRAPAPPRRVDRERERRTAQLRAVRDQVASQLGIDGSLLAPRAALEALVDGRVADREGLHRCLGREWRTAVLAPHLLPVLASFSAAPDGEHAPPSWRGGVARALPLPGARPDRCCTHP